MAPRFELPFVIQDGPDAYPAKHCRTIGLVNYKRLMGYYRDATVVVSHTSSGPLVYAKKFRKPIITLPRRPELGEAVDDHQVETALALKPIDEAMRITLDDVAGIEPAIRTVLRGLEGGMHYGSGTGELERLQNAIRSACLE
jgi:UDP-N-acetylglucosamine transferase subunit ALG13